MNQSPWLQIAIAMSEDLKNQPPDVQQTARQMSQKTYPETWRAIREKEQGKE